MSDTDALVNPAMLRWARESTSLDVKSGAKAATIANPEKLVAAERGEAKISFRQLQNFARYCRLPLAVFYLPEPPADEIIPTDFRSGPASEHGRSSRLIRLLRRARERRDAALDLFEDLDHEITRMPAVASRQSIIETLTPLMCVKQWPSERRSERWAGARALSTTKELVESALPVLIFEFDVSYNELRGCSMYDEHLSIIGVSSEDPPNTRRFTIAHELVHLFARESGLCTPLLPHGSRETETACDEIAGEVLLPQAMLERDLAEMSVRHTPAQKVTRLVSSYALSYSASAVRLAQAGAITPSEMRALLDLYEAQWRAKRAEQAKKPGGPNFYMLQAQRLGPTFASAVLSGIESEFVSITQATDLLGVSPSYKSIAQVRENLVTVFGR